MAIGNATHLLQRRWAAPAALLEPVKDAKAGIDERLKGAARQFIEHLLVISAQKVAGAKHPGNDSAAVRSDIGGFGVDSDFAWQGVASFAGRPPLYRLDLSQSPFQLLNVGYFDVEPRRRRGFHALN